MPDPCGRAARQRLTVNFSGMCLIPLMKLERRRLTGAGELDVGEAVEDLVEHHTDLHAGQVRAEAEVRAAAAERDVLVRRAARCRT